VCVLYTSCSVVLFHVVNMKEYTRCKKLLPCVADTCVYTCVAVSNVHSWALCQGPLLWPEAEEWFLAYFRIVMAHYVMAHYVMARYVMAHYHHINYYIPSIISIPSSRLCLCCVISNHNHLNLHTPSPCFTSKLRSCKSRRKIGIPVRNKGTGRSQQKGVEQKTRGFKLRSCVHW
jgi:hypothetical protein